MNEDIKKRMNELENQLKIQNENLNKISTLANKKEEKLNNDISQYLKQINDLKNELELLNNTITNLTEEKENNTIKLTELIHENEQLKKNKNSLNNNDNNNNNEAQNKKYEELIIKLKKNIMKLNEEKKSLEEVIFKQEEKVNELSLKVDNTKKEIMKKDKELKESMEYNAKLTSTINFHKKEIQKLKQSTNYNNNNQNNLNNNKNKDVMNIMNLQKEIQTIKKEIETKDNKINLLSMNNKILQGKVNKLSQTTKNGFHFDQNNTNINNINNNTNNVRTTINPKNIDNKTLHKDKNKVFIVAKPKQSQHLPGMINGRQNSTNIRAKNDFYKNNEDNFNYNNNINYEYGNRSKYTNLNQLRKTQKRNNSNINNIKMQNNNNINNPNMNNINITKSNYITKNYNKSDKNNSLDNKYKEIESKYKKEINKEMKDDTLFDEDIINNFDIKEEIIVGNSIEPIEVVSNMVSQTLKPKKKKQYNLNDQSLNMSQEKDFQIIESYCYLSGQKEDDNNNYDNSQAIFNKDNTLKENESKIENNQVEELHNHVQKILDEFN